MEAIKRALGKIVVRLFRYRIVGDPPHDPVCVMVAAPHTSNWDFILMLAMAWATGVRPMWLGKKEIDLGINWPISLGEQPILSASDANAPNLTEAEIFD